MKILFLTPRYSPHVGGVEKHVEEISKKLVKKNNSVVVITEQFSPGLKKVEIIDGVKIIRISLRKAKWFTKFFIWYQMFKNYEDFKSADIIHCHDVFFWYFPLRFIFLKKKVFTTFHGYETIFPPKKKAIFIRRVSARLSNGVIHVGDFIEKWYKTRPDVVLHGGVERFKKGNVKNIKKENLRILFVGRLEKDTGVLTYIQALNLLRKKRVQFELDVYGEGTLRKKIEQYGIVHGFVTLNEKKMNSVDIVFASTYLSMLQGLAAKKLVCAVYENPLKKDYLLLSPFVDKIIIASSADDLVRKILEVLRNKKKLYQMIEEGYVLSQENTWDIVLQKYEKLWRNSIEN